MQQWLFSLYKTYVFSSTGLNVNALTVNMDGFFVSLPQTPPIEGLAEAQTKNTKS
jgi:hypothetical protein